VGQAFTAVLDSDPWKSEFEAAATDDASRHAAGALRTYVQVNQRISSGSLPEYADEQQAQDDLKAGRAPAPNPEYEQAVADVDGVVARRTGGEGDFEAVGGHAVFQMCYGGRVRKRGVSAPFFIG